MPTIVSDESDIQGSTTLGYVPAGWENHPKYNPAARLQQEQAQDQPQQMSPVYATPAEITEPVYQTGDKYPLSFVQNIKAAPMIPSRSIGEVLDEIAVESANADAIEDALDDLPADHPTRSKLISIAVDHRNKALALNAKLREQMVNL